VSQVSRVGNVELIALRGAAKRYRIGGPWVLADVDLAVAPGTVAVASGANGSGKSTLLRILAGSPPPMSTPRSATCWTVVDTSSASRRDPTAP
jgi:ABC-type bacteriocin/lantibiotic exporter with double-glycine peptidase domain